MLVARATHSYYLWNLMVDGMWMRCCRHYTNCKCENWEWQKSASNFTLTPYTLNVKVMRVCIYIHLFVRSLHQRHVLGAMTLGNRRGRSAYLCAHCGWPFVLCVIVSYCEFICLCINTRTHANRGSESGGGGRSDSGRGDSGSNARGIQF